MIGERFGRLVVIGPAFQKNGHTYRRCRCTCSARKVREGQQSNLTSGNTKSCGCFNREVASQTAMLLPRRHGGSSLPEYGAWAAMHERCRREKAENYPMYGGRGVRVCRRWRSFKNFFADMGPKPTSKHTLDRKRNHLGYTPSNCRWATVLEQNNNKRNNVRVKIEGVTKTVAQWAAHAGLSKACMHYRLRVAKWNPKRAISPSNT